MARPVKYETAEEMQVIIDKYFEDCFKNKLAEMQEDADTLMGTTTDDIFPTVSGLAYALGLTRAGLVCYEKKDNPEFFDTVKEAKQKIEAGLEQRLFYQNATGVIFNLKNNYGWKDKQEVDNTSSDGSMTPKGVELVIVDPKNETEKTDT